MPTSYQHVDATVHAMATEIMEKHHPRLRFADGEFVKLCIMFAFGDANSNEAPLKVNGYPCAAVVSVINLKQRVDKRADAEILIDQSQWDSMSEAQRRALLDHEITHLELQVEDNTGIVKTDDIGRPKLRLRLHDWQLGGFREVAHRHGEDAPEVMLAKQFEKDYGDVALAGDKLFA